MNAKVHREVEKKIARIKKGQLIFLSDFRGLGTEVAVRKALSRLTREGKLKRVAQGIYLVPKKDPVFGDIIPSTENIVEGIAKREHIRIKPVGAFAMHKLGLTTQVPMKLVYLTDGAARVLKIGKSTVKFKRTTPKKLSLEGKLSSLIIQALDEIGIENLEDNQIERIKELLLKEDRRSLMHDIKLASVEVSNFLLGLLKEKTL